MKTINNLREGSIRLDQKCEIVRVIPEYSRTDGVLSGSHPHEMEKYTVLIEEHIVQEFPINAHNLSHALEKAEKAYKQGQLIVHPSAPITRLIMALNNETGESTEWKEF